MRYVRDLQIDRCYKLVSVLNQQRVLDLSSAYGRSSMPLYLLCVYLIFQQKKQSCSYWVYVIWWRRPEGEFLHFHSTSDNRIHIRTQWELRGDSRGFTLRNICWDLYLAFEGHVLAKDDYPCGTKVIATPRPFLWNIQKVNEAGMNSDSQAPAQFR